MWSLTWAPDGRATFQYGDAITPGEPHIVWRRVGIHAIYRRPQSIDQARGHPGTGVSAQASQA